MVAQLNFEFEHPKEKLRKKRVRFKVPTYKKFYSLWQYDREKFRALLNIHLKNIQTSPYKNQWQILDECWVRDEKGNKLKDSDEKHIFRIRTLHKIYEKIFSYCDLFILSPDENLIIKKSGLIIYPCDMQAEIEGTWQESIEDRLKIHLKLLRLLREGFSVGESIRRVKNEI